MAARVLAFAGSARAESYNKRLLGVLVGAVESTGVECSVLDLRDYPLPLYDGDLEDREGLPPKAVELRELMASHQALLITSPEYNSSITPLLKNTVDWITRTADAKPDISLFTGKLAAIASTSPGAWGGMRALSVVRSMLSNIGVNVLGNQVAVPMCMQAFAEDGSLSDPRMAAWAGGLGVELGETLKKLAD